MADDNSNLRRQQIFKDVTILAGGNKTSQIIDISEYKLVGNVTLQIEVSGDGTAKFEFEQSNDYDAQTKTGTFVLPVSGFSIVTLFTKTSGTGANGKDLLNVPMFNSEAFRIKCSETVSANSITVTAWLNMQ